jgi:hypothetical protein
VGDLRLLRKCRYDCRRRRDRRDDGRWHRGGRRFAAGNGNTALQGEAFTLGLGHSPDTSAPNTEPSGSRKRNTEAAMSEVEQAAELAHLREYLADVESGAHPPSHGADAPRYNERESRG